MLDLSFWWRMLEIRSDFVEDILHKSFGSLGGRCADNITFVAGVTALFLCQSVYVVEGKAAGES